jgi:hypothetical protein
LWRFYAACPRPCSIFAAPQHHTYPYEEEKSEIRAEWASTALHKAPIYPNKGWGLPEFGRE